MNNNGLGGLTDNMEDFFEDDGNDSGGTPTLGRIAYLVLDFIVFGLALYSGYHGINATRSYRAAAGLGNAAGIIGIIIIEAALIAIYEAFKARLIIGGTQKAIAGFAFAVGTILACLGIVGDSQMNAGIEVTSWLRTYMVWGLPLAPVVMALGAAGIVVTHPELQRKIRAALKRDEFAKKKHDAQMKAEDARLTIAKTTANVQLNTLKMAATLVDQAYRTPEVQSYIMEMALSSLPDIMRQVGVNIPYGTVIDGVAIDAPPPNLTQEDDEPADAAPPSTGVIGGLRSRLSRKGNAQPAQPAQPQQTGLTAADVERMFDERLSAFATTLAAQNNAPRHAPQPQPNGAAPANGGGGNEARPL